MHTLSPTRSTHAHHYLATTAICATLTFAPAFLGAQPTPAQQPDFVQLTLLTDIDSKTAKPGDPVITRINGSYDLSGTAIPSGTRLTGAIAAVDHQPPSISIELNAIPKKGKPSTAVQVTLVAIAPPPPNYNLPGLPHERNGLTGPDPDAPTDVNADIANALVFPGSAIKHVTLNHGTLFSNKDFKLANGTRLAVTLSPVATQ